MKKDFAETLKEMRVNAGYSQKEVYEMFNIRQSTFSAWETGRAEPSADMLLKLCKLYNVTDILGAFGFDGYNEDGSLQLNINEISVIEKYRSLDPHGKEMVDFTLLKEWERSTAEARAEEKVVPMAVREDANYAVGATEEEMMHAPQYMKEDTNYLAVKAAHNDAEITDEELEKMERDSALIVEMAKKKR